MSDLSDLRLFSLERNREHRVRRDTEISARVHLVSRNVLHEIVVGNGSASLYGLFTMFEFGYFRVVFGAKMAKLEVSGSPGS